MATAKGELRSSVPYAQKWLASTDILLQKSVALALAPATYVLWVQLGPDSTPSAARGGSRAARSDAHKSPDPEFHVRRVQRVGVDTSTVGKRPIKPTHWHTDVSVEYRFATRRSVHSSHPDLRAPANPIVLSGRRVPPVDLPNSSVGCRYVYTLPTHIGIF
jgi:hypothetical protein